MKRPDKFCVIINHDKDLSAKVQNKLFSMGYTWYSRSTLIKEYDIYLINCNGNGQLTYLYNDNLTPSFRTIFAEQFLCPGIFEEL